MYCYVASTLFWGGGGHVAQGISPLPIPCMNPWCYINLFSIFWGGCIIGLTPHIWTPELLLTLYCQQHRLLQLRGRSYACRLFKVKPAAFLFKVIIRSTRANIVSDRTRKDGMSATSVSLRKGLLCFSIAQKACFVAHTNEMTIIPL